MQGPTSRIQVSGTSYKSVPTLSNEIYAWMTAWQRLLRADPAPSRAATGQVPTPMKLPHTRHRACMGYRKATVARRRFGPVKVNSMSTCAWPLKY